MRKTFLILLAAVLACFAAAPPPVAAASTEWSATTSQGWNSTNASRRHYFAGPVTIGSPLYTASGVGAKNGATVTATEYGTSTLHQTKLTLAATPLAVTDSLAYLGVKIYDFPEGRILVLGVTSSLQWAVTTARDTTINDSASLTWAVGTATASNATLATTMVDLIPKTTKVLAAATTALNTASTAALAASAHFDGTGTAKDAYLNAAFETATDIDGDGTLTATGTVTITWVQLGDY